MKSETQAMITSELCRRALFIAGRRGAGVRTMGLLKQELAKIASFAEPQPAATFLIVDEVGPPYSPPRPQLRFAKLSCLRRQPTR
jgi:hypothetical protein